MNGGPGSPHLLAEEAVRQNVSRVEALSRGHGLRGGEGFLHT